ncbi:MAG: DUF6492 family protein [Cyanobacteria bacterium J06638_22]
MTHPAKRFAIVTVSYAPDFERCRLLTESTERCLLGDTKHYIIVDRKDVQLFSALKSSKVELLVVEDILPWWIFRVPFFTKGWISLRTPPIRNWILQQLVKLSVVQALQEDVVVFCDSDVTFIRPFDIASLFLHEDQVALLRVDFQSDDVISWTNASKQILGIEKEDVPFFNYVGNLIAWRRENVFKMYDRIEEVNGMSWIQAICKHWNISEYMLYGMMVDHVLEPENSGHFISSPELVKPAWSYPLDSQENVNQFFSTVDDTHIGVMIHSKYRAPISAYRHKFESLWQKNCELNV